MIEKQKICIIGGGLTGLITAVVLAKFNIKIDLIVGSINQNIKSSRTTAISQDNYDFLKKLNISNFIQKEFWPCSKMKLYTEAKKGKFTEIFKLNNDRSHTKKILYMMNNSKMIRHIIRNIKKRKLITLKINTKISEIVSSGILKSVRSKNKNNTKYNLIIICTGNNSNITKEVFDDETYEHSYEEESITTVLKHSPFKNNIARQIFFNNEIFALLPMSKTKTSVVLIVKKNLINKYKNKKNLYLKKKIKFYTKNFLKKIKFNSKIEFRDLNLSIRKKYYKDRVLLFGDALHAVHPFVGQGFNMVLRDLISLEKTLKNKINLGLDIGSSDILAEFSNEIKPRNLVYSLGIDFLKKGFSFQKKSFKEFRNKILVQLNKNNFIKDFFINFANKGFKF